jgi:DNA helicase-2/ATP-dependent DNA helicase PcrA
MLARISAAKEQGLEPSDVEKDAGCDQEDRLLADIYREYQRTLRDNNALDFDDLLLLTVRLFQKDPEVLGYYQERFRYIMVDEYQDTNHIQFLFVSLLAGRYRNLCVVGDDDQSIYKFRGADIRNILDFEDTFPDTKVIRLEQNYRSTKNILAAANGVISHNEDRKQKMSIFKCQEPLWTGLVQSLQPYLAGPVKADEG